MARHAVEQCAPRKRDAPSFLVGKGARGIGLQSLRWQLTLGFVGLLIAIGAILGAFLYLELSRFLISNTATSLRDQARTVINLAIGPKESSSPDLGLGRGADQLAKDLDSATTAVSVFDRTGTRLLPKNIAPNSASVDTGESRDMGAILAFPEQPDVVAKVLQTGVEARYLSQGTTGRVLVIVLPIQVRGRVIGVAELATSLRSVDATLARMRLFLLSGRLLGMLLALIAGPLLVRRLLRPLTRMASTAQEIAAGDLSLRVPPRETADELGKLTAAFNRMLDEINVAMEARRHSEELTRQFVGDASHELRTPLAVLQGYADILLRGAVEDASERDRVLSRMQAELSRMSRLVTDLLTLTRLGNRQETQREAVDLSLLAQEVCLEVAQWAPEYRLHFAGEQSLTVNGNSDQLHRVILNLLQNAVRHTEAGGEISIRVSRLQGRACLQVIDSGEGIAAEHLPHVFERFYRVDQARSRQTGSTGLGLAIVRGIVEQHGGTVAVESTPEHGATFTIDLSLRSPESRVVYHA
ncbi:MAG: sensor histidine kinase [Dehalococcoidia bacterium]